MLQSHQSPFYTLKPRMHQMPDDSAEKLIVHLFNATAKGKVYRTAQAYEWLKFIEHINPSLFILTDRQLIHLSRFANAIEEVELSIEEFNHLIRQVKREVPSTIYDQRAGYTDTYYDNESLNDNNEAVMEESEEDQDDQSTTPNHRNNNYSGECSQQQQQYNPFLAALHAQHNIPYEEEAPSDSFSEDEESINHPSSASFQLPVRRRMHDRVAGSDYDQLTELNLLKRDKAELISRIREFNLKTDQMEQEIEQHKHIATEAIQQEKETQKKVKELRNLMEEYKRNLIIADRQLKDKDKEVNSLRTALGNRQAGDSDKMKLLYEELEKEIESHKGIRNQLTIMTEENARLEFKILELERKASTASIVRNGETDQLKRAMSVKDKELDTLCLTARVQEAHMDSMIRQQTEQFDALKRKSDAETERLQKTLGDYQSLCRKYNAEATKVLERLNASKQTLPQKSLMCFFWGFVLMLVVYVLAVISVYVRVSQIRPNIDDAPFRFMNSMGQWILSEDFSP